MAVRILPPSVGDSYEGLSTDSKPTGVVINSTFREQNTQSTWITYDGTNWVLKEQTGEVQATPTSNTVLARLKDIKTSVAELKTLIVLAAGTAVVGNVGIDQTTPETTNRVVTHKRQAPALHRDNISAQDILATPAAPGAGDRPTEGSLLANTNYKYRVSAVNDNGVTVASTVGNITTSADGLNTHRIRLTITKVTGALKYNIFCSVDASPKYQGQVADGGGATTDYDVDTTGAGAVSVTEGFAWNEPAVGGGIDCAGFEGVDFDCKITLGGTSPVIELTPIYYDSVDAQWYAGESLFFTGSAGGGGVIRGKLRVRCYAKGAIAFLQVRSLTGTTPSFSLTVYGSRF